MKDESSTVDFSKELETDVSLCEKVADISLDMVGDFVFCSLNNRSWHQFSTNFIFVKITIVLVFFLKKSDKHQKF